MSLDISVHHVNDSGYTQDFEVSPSVFPVLSEIRKKGECDFYTNINIHFNAVAIKDIIEITGYFKTDIRSNCARCLETFSQELNKPFELTFSSFKSGDIEFADEEEYIRMADERGVHVFKGDQFNISEVLQEEIVMAIPDRTFCRESCRGICTACGKNLNNETCTCDHNDSSPFSALKGLKLNK